MLSKRESAYRRKLFAERRDNKKDQNDIDSFVKEFRNTYKALYLVHATGLSCGVFAGIALRKLLSRFLNIGVTAKTTEGSFRNLSEVLNDVAGVWSSLPSEERECLAEAIGNNV